MAGSEGEGLIKEALGALVIEGHGEPQRVALRSHESHHRAFARFDMEGDYQISIEYVVKGRKNRTEPISFTYTRKTLKAGQNMPDEHMKHQHNG